MSEIEAIYISSSFFSCSFVDLFLIITQELRQAIEHHLVTIARFGMQPSAGRFWNRFVTHAHASRR